MLAVIQIQDSVMYLKIFILRKFHMLSVPSFLMKLSHNWMSRDKNTYGFRNITKAEFKNLKLGGMISSIIGILLRFRIVRQMLKQGLLKSSHTARWREILPLEVEGNSIKTVPIIQLSVFVLISIGMWCCSCY